MSYKNIIIALVLATCWLQSIESHAAPPRWAMDYYSIHNAPKNMPYIPKTTYRSTTGRYNGNISEGSSYRTSTPAEVPNGKGTGGNSFSVPSAGGTRGIVDMSGDSGAGQRFR